MEVARSLDQRLERRRRYSFLTNNPFSISFPVCLTFDLLLLLLAAWLPRVLKNRARHLHVSLRIFRFANSNVARDDGARIIRVAISQSSPSLDLNGWMRGSRPISAIGGKSNEIYIVDTNQLASVHGSRGHESSVTSQPFRRFTLLVTLVISDVTQRLSLSLSHGHEQLTASRKIGEDESPEWSKTLIMPIPVISSRLIGSFEKHPRSRFTRMTFSRELDSPRRMLEKKEREKRWGAIRVNGASLELIKLIRKAFGLHDFLPRLSLSLIRGALYVIQSRCTSEIMRRCRYSYVNEQHARRYVARMIYRFTAQGYPCRLILANYAQVDNRWRTRRNKVSFRFVSSD